MEKTLKESVPEVQGAGQKAEESRISAPEVERLWREFVRLKFEPQEDLLLQLLCQVEDLVRERGSKKEWLIFLLGKSLGVLEEQQR